MAGILPAPVHVRERAALPSGTIDCGGSPADADVSQAWSLDADFLIANEDPVFREIIPIAYLAPYPRASFAQCPSLEHTMEVCDLLRPSVLIFWTQNILIYAGDIRHGLSRLLGPRPWLNLLLCTGWDGVMPYVTGHEFASRIEMGECPIQPEDFHLSMARRFNFFVPAEFLATRKLDSHEMVNTMPVEQPTLVSRLKWLFRRH